MRKISEYKNERTEECKNKEYKRQKNIKRRT